MSVPVSNLHSVTDEAPRRIPHYINGQRFEEIGRAHV